MIVPFEGAAIAQVAFESREEASVSWETEPIDAVEIGFDGLVALVAVFCAAVALALLPVAVGVAILVRSTVPLEFAGAAGLAILAAIKVSAGATGLLAAIRAPLRSELPVGTD